MKLNGQNRRTFAEVKPVFTVLFLSFVLAACQTTAPNLETPKTPTPEDGRVLRSRLSNVTSFATYYLNPSDQSVTDQLGHLDLAIVQPSITDDQRRTIQVLGNAVAYLAIGEIGPNNDYYVNGQTLKGSQVIAQHQSDGWFVGINKSYGAPLINLANAQARDFVISQGQVLIDRRFDGLFLDTVDDAELFNVGDPAAQFDNVFVTLYAGRPNYATMKRAYIDTVKTLRRRLGNIDLIQNGGFDTLLDAENPSGGTERYIDAVMHESATTYYRPAAGSVDSTNPGNYTSWRDYYRDGSVNQTNRDEDKAFRDNRDAHARTYKSHGGVVLAQDFAVPNRTDLFCYAYARAKTEGWIPSYADAFFTQAYPYPDKSVTNLSYEGCATYDFETEPDYQVVFNPRVAYAAKGRSTRLNFQVASIRNGNANVRLSLDGLPGGVTGSLSANAVIAGSGTPVNLELTVDANTASGELIIPVRTTSSGESTVYDLRLVVIEPTEGLIVSNAGDSTLLAFDDLTTLNATSASSRKFTGARQAWTIITDPSGNQYAAERIADATKPARILKFAPYNFSSPVQVITDGLNVPTALAVDTSGNLWAANYGTTANVCVNPEVIYYTPNSSVKTGGFLLSNPSLYGCPKQIAFSGGRLWVATTYGLLLSYSDPTTTPTLASVTNFPDMLGEIGSLAFDSSGNLWLTGILGTQGSVIRVAASGVPAVAGNIYAAPVDASSVTRLTNGLPNPFGLTFDSLGNLWIVNQSDVGGGVGSLVKFAATSLNDSAASPVLSLPLPTRYTLGIASLR